MADPVLTRIESLIAILAEEGLDPDGEQALIDELPALRAAIASMSTPEGELEGRAFGDGEARRNWIAAEQALLDAYVDDYEMCQDEGYYTPTEFERALIRDALQGFVVEHDELLGKHLSSLPSTVRGEDWRDIETAPKDGTVVILFARARTATASVPVLGWWNPDDGWIELCFGPNRPVGIVPSLWMPRPEFPQ